MMMIIGRKTIKPINLLLVYLRLLERKNPIIIIGKKICRKPNEINSSNFIEFIKVGLSSVKFDWERISGLLKYGK